MPDQTRNENGHKPSRIANVLWNDRYAAQGGGLMDFWDTLSAAEKNQCREILKEIMGARDETSEEIKNNKT